MINIVLAQWLKMKKSRSQYCFLFLPLLFLIFTFSTLISPNNPSGILDNVPIIQMSIFNLWSLFLSHIIIVLGIYYNLKLDKDSKGDIIALANNWNLKNIFLAKSIVLIIYLGISYLILSLIVIFSIYVITGNFQNIPLILITSMLMFLVQICFIPINIFLLKFFNVLVVLIFNVAINLIATIYTSLSKLFWLIPQGYTIKIATITMRIHPNGTLLDQNSIYYNDLHSLAIVLVCSFILTIIFIVLNLLIINKYKYS